MGDTLDNLMGKVSMAARPLETVHVLFIDMVKWTKSCTDQQAETQAELNRLVNSIGEVIEAKRTGKLIVRPSGDGMSLLFLQDILHPVRTAIQLDHLIKKRNPSLKKEVGAEIHLRMGINSGPVFIGLDFNGQMDVAGEGINVAQRVMDAGDAGHILLSENIALTLARLQMWRQYVKPLGTYQDKHGNPIELSTLVGSMPGYPHFGSEYTPTKVSRQWAQRKERAEEAEKVRGEAIWAEKKRSYLRAVGFVCGTALLLGIPGKLWFKQSPSTFCDYFPAFCSATSKPPPTPTPTPGTQRSQGKVSVIEIAIPTEQSSVPSRISAYSTFSEDRPVSVNVPSLKGKTFEQAAFELAKKGLILAHSSNFSRPSRFAEGLICAQSKTGRIPSGSTIYVTVSTGDYVRESTSQTTPEPPPESDPIAKASATVPPEEKIKAPNYTGILIDASHLDNYAPAPPFALNLLEPSSDQVSVYTAKDYNEQNVRIRNRLGATYFSCRAESVADGVKLNLGSEQGKMCRELLNRNPDIPIGIVYKPR